MLLAIALSTGFAQAAVQQEKLTKKELKALTASAKTPADHERVAAYYRAKVQHLWAKYREHEAQLAEYYKNTSRYPSKYPTMGDHCRGLAGYYKMSAERAAALAEMHERLAQESR